MPYTVVMIRHGESQWNIEQKFCGWFDSDLTDFGISEAKSAGQMLKEKGYTFDVAYTSLLKRAIKTLYHVQDELDLHWIPVTRHWRLNERMYGALTGLSKSEMAAEHGEEQVKIYRRSYTTRPPPLDETHEHYPGNDPKYALVDKQLLPKAECLKDTVARVLPFWYDVIVPSILRGEKVVIAAHGNSLRALVQHLDDMCDAELLELNIPNGIPLVYELDENLEPVTHYYLADDEAVKAGVEKCISQGKAPNAAL